MMPNKGLRSSRARKGSCLAMAPRYLLPRRYDQEKYEAQSGEKMRQRSKRTRTADSFLKQCASSPTPLSKTKNIRLGFIQSKKNRLRKFVDRLHLACKIDKLETHLGPETER